MPDSLDEYTARFLASAKEKGHTLYCDEDGVDLFRLSEGFHNGPACSACHGSWCMHCTSPDRIEPCDSGVSHRAYVAKRDRKEWERLVAEYGPNGPARATGEQP